MVFSQFSQHICFVFLLLPFHIFHIFLFSSPCSTIIFSYISILLFFFPSSNLVSRSLVTIFNMFFVILFRQFHIFVGYLPIPVLQSCFHHSLLTISNSFISIFLTFSVYLFDLASNPVSSSLLTIFSTTFIFRFRPFHAHLPLLSSYSTLASTTASTSKFSQYFPVVLYFFHRRFSYLFSILLHIAFKPCFQSSPQDCPFISRLSLLTIAHFAFITLFQSPYCSLYNFQNFCLHSLLLLSFLNF